MANFVIFTNMDGNHFATRVSDVQSVIQRPKVMRANGAMQTLCPVSRLVYRPSEAYSEDYVDVFGSVEDIVHQIGSN